MRALPSARCTGVRLYTLRIKKGTFVTINKRSASSRIVELASVVSQGISLSNVENWTCFPLPIGVAQIKKLRTCVIKIVTFKGGHLMCG